MDYFYEISDVVKTSLNDLWTFRYIVHVINQKLLFVLLKKRKKGNETFSSLL